MLAVLVVTGLCLATEPTSDSRLELRLQQEVNSYSSAVGDPVQAVLIAPYTVSGLPRIAPGARVMGEITEVRRVGVGFVRETATLTFRFSKVELPDGTWVNIHAQLLAIDNARETVDKNGRIRGIRSTNTPGFRAAGLLTTLAAVDPIALAFSTAAFASVLRFSEPEIRLKAGTEFIVKLLDGPVWEPLPPQLLGLAKPMPSAFLERIPYRTQTPGRRQESDLTNLLLAGSPEAIERAFLAAGWQVPEALTSATAYRTFRALAGNQEYSGAPMSTLLLDGQSPVQSWSKALNTFAKRHHLRLYATNQRWQDKPVFTAAATQDVAINFSRGRGLFTHLIDENIDRERNKVVHDLLFTGCVEAAEQMPRPWVPAEAFNATGQELVTDRAIAVLVFSDCFSARRFDEIAAPAPGPYRGNPVTRVVRQTVLTVRNDLFRGTLVYQGVSILTMATKNYRRSRNALQPIKGPTMSGQVVRSPKPARQSSEWTPASVELAINAGFMVFSNSSVGAEGITLRLGPNPSQMHELVAANRIDPGFALGASVTLNSFRWISHELGFGYQRGNLKLGLDGTSSVVEQRTGYLTRQFTSNTLFHLRPRESRLRPYFAFGPVLQLVHLTDAPFTKARGLLRYGLTNVGIVRSAYNFGNAPPLQGGGIFQVGLQMGAGIRYRLSEHWTMRADYRNTCTPPPDLLRKSLEPQVLPSLIQRGRIAQQRVTLGLAFTF